MKKVFILFIGITLITNLQAQTSLIYQSDYLEGPDAPDVQLTLQNGGIQIDLNNPAGSNNINEAYAELDTAINNGDSIHRFQGYLIYQAINDTIRPLENLFNSSKMRLIAQCDIIDSITILGNSYLDTLTGNCIYLSVVNGSNLGTQYTYQISWDAFSSNALQQGETYCYYAFAYAYNVHKVFTDCGIPLPLQFLISNKSSTGAGISGTCINFNVTGIDDLTNQLDLNPTIYPNPVHQYANILFEKPQDVQVHLLDITGKVLFENEYTNVEKIPLNTNNLKRGLYFVKIVSKRGFKTIKFIKQ